MENPIKLDLQDAYDFLNFWINKDQGLFYSPARLDLLVDRGQMSYYSDLQPKYGLSDRINTSLSPFIAQYTYTNSTSPLGVVTLPAEDDPLEFMDFIDAIPLIMDETNTVRRRPLPFPNDDERTYLINSQIRPLSTTNPFGEWIGKGKIQLWPKEPQAGVVKYFRRPVKPFFDYTLVSGRVIMYNEADSVQLEWLERDQNAVLLKALESISINASEKDIQEFAELKTQQNYQGINRT